MIGPVTKVIFFVKNTDQDFVLEAGLDGETDFNIGAQYMLSLTSQTGCFCSIGYQIHPRRDQGAFINDVDKILPIIDHLPPVDICEGISLLK